MRRSIAMRVWMTVGLFAGGECNAQVDSLLAAHGSGEFSMPGGPGYRDAEISVFYHLPERSLESSPILIVLPGSGRNGDDYRDSWIELSEKYGVLVFSPSYPAEFYDAGVYLLGGMIENFELRNVVEEASGVVRLNDGDILFDVNADRSEWLFNDFERLFDLVRAELGSRQSGYDIFGHSAGGQILHRMALVYPESRANRIVAANAGFYTLPRLDEPLIFGVGDLQLSAEDLRHAFSSPLTVLLGETDDENETRGTHLRTPLADRQGVGRLARGQYFYRESHAIAEALDLPFLWHLGVVPDVGHDFRRMALAAADFLYGAGE